MVSQAVIEFSFHSDCAVLFAPSLRGAGCLAGSFKSCMPCADGFTSPQEGVPEGSELEAELELITIRKARLPHDQSPILCIFRHSSMSRAGGIRKTAELTNAAVTPCCASRSESCMKLLPRASPSEKRHSIWDFHLRPAL